MHVLFNPDLCEANAVCCGLAPEVFELDAEEQLIVKLADVPAEFGQRVELAVSRCPKNALELR